ncbi:hypothetical protein BX661DRAFT_189204 [Kickxella alabastrina]|uniref:uncharacterized protein n=1 Tax=Kickxella alabastrina TaxID=61397 RepID=UPI00221E9CDD|nr:uncharacterized protein BX661DRAFT_189204 [Kickxella alabastrina]KAI7820370.1 hypothetical protein BX661DRAFT_189204 [Kickxella alabastrina]
MKISYIPIILSISAALTHAHYKCTTDEAFDVLFNDITADLLAEHILDYLKKGSVQWRNDIDQVDPRKSAVALILRYRAMLEKLPVAIASRFPRI